MSSTEHSSEEAEAEVQAITGMTIGSDSLGAGNESDASTKRHRHRHHHHRKRKSQVDVLNVIDQSSDGDVKKSKSEHHHHSASSSATATPTTSPPSTNGSSSSSSKDKDKEASRHHHHHHHHHHRSSRKHDSKPEKLSRSTPPSRASTPNLVCTEKTTLPRSMDDHDLERIGPNSFERVQLIGRGDVGRVYLVKKKTVDPDAVPQLYAMKILNKKEMISRNKIKRALTEREILATTNHPFIVTLYYRYAHVANACRHRHATFSYSVSDHAIVCVGCVCAASNPRTISTLSWSTVVVVSSFACSNDNQDVICQVSPSTSLVQLALIASCTQSNGTSGDYWKSISFLTVLS
jgi:hypothetical protein